MALSHLKGEKMGEQGKLCGECDQERESRGVFQEGQSEGRISGLPGRRMDTWAGAESTMTWRLCEDHKPAWRSRAVQSALGLATCDL